MDAAIPAYAPPTDPLFSDQPPEHDGRWYCPICPCLACHAARTGGARELAPQHLLPAQAAPAFRIVSRETTATTPRVTITWSNGDGREHEAVVCVDPDTDDLWSYEASGCFPSSQDDAESLLLAAVDAYWREREGGWL